MRQHPDYGRPGRGFTLVEMLIAMAITLVLIFALAQAFAIVGETVAQGRAAIEMSNSLRSVTQRLEEDLNGLTVPVRPWIDDSAGQGYFESRDGASTDSDWNADGAPDTLPGAAGLLETSIGDIDDVVALTTRSRGTPFVGTVVRAQGATYVVDSIESQTAEVIWWIQFQDVNGNGVRDAGEPYTIYRRVLVVRPDLDPAQAPFSLVNRQYANLGALTAELTAFLNNNDISVQVRAWQLPPPSSGWQLQVKPNSLGDLTLRENRYVHFLSSFPYPLNVTTLKQLTLKQAQMQLVTAAGATLPDRTGEDVMLSDALAFDVQVFDPAAPLMPSDNTGEALVPSDPGYWTAVETAQPLPAGVQATPPSNMLGLGAYVDLGYGDRYDRSHNLVNRVANWSRFARRPNLKSLLIDRGADGKWGRANVDDDGNGTTDDLSEAGWYNSDDVIHYVYCTWAAAYERDGVDQDDGGSGLVDEGTNGFDDDGVNGVDDADELETSPPYPAPLRGIQVRIRVWDPDSRQVRQATVATDFVPE